MFRGLSRVPGFLSPVEKKIGFCLSHDFWRDFMCTIVIETPPFVLIFDVGVVMARAYSVFQVSINITPGRFSPLPRSLVNYNSIEII